MWNPVKKWLDDRNERRLAEWEKEQRAFWKEFEKEQRELKAEDERYAAHERGNFIGRVVEGNHREVLRAAGGIGKHWDDLTVEQKAARAESWKRGVPMGHLDRDVTRLDEDGMKPDFAKASVSDYLASVKERAAAEPQPDRSQDHERAR